MKKPSERILEIVNEVKMGRGKDSQPEVIGMAAIIDYLDELVKEIRGKE